ncbi:MAG: hypothetical protein IJN80_07520 [Clostridia bacterium]|nr:hypothetical protein [Clostridia bacterium]
MDYEATIVALSKRIDALETQLKRLEQAHIHTRANTKVSDVMLKACYDAGIAAAFEGNSDFNAYTEQVCFKTRMNPGTARILIMTAYALKQGELFKCIISGKAAEFFLEQLQKDFGAEGLQRGLSALELHIQYRRSLKRDTTLLEKIANQFKENIN